MKDLKHAFKQRMLALGDFFDRYRQVFRHSWSERKNYDAKRFLPQEAEFLPAALSLQETPVSPVPRVTMWLLVSFAVIPLLWACFGKIDVVATAQGKIVPGDRIKTIQPFETAEVRKIYVSDGQAVKAGQLLVELDATSAMADADRVKGDRDVIDLQAARAKALMNAVKGMGSSRLPAMAGIEKAKFDEAQGLLDAQYAEFRSKMSKIDMELARRHAELESTRSLVRKLELTVPIASQRAEDYKRLVADNYVSQHGYLEREQARIEQEADLATQRSRVNEIQASLRESQELRKSLVAETVRVALDSLNDAQQKAASLRQDQIKAGVRVESMKLASPVDGVVQQLAIHTVGGVVTPAQPLMVIVPHDDALEVEAFLENKDIGFVNAGQDAEVKIETFEYTKYGTIDAKVAHVSNDAINDEKRGLIYSMRVRMARAGIKVGEQLVNLSPGMAVTVEVKTAKRRLIEYFLSPLLQYANEGLRER